MDDLKRVYAVLKPSVMPELEEEGEQRLSYERRDVSYYLVIMTRMNVCYIVPTLYAYECECISTVCTKPIGSCYLRSELSRNTLSYSILYSLSLNML